MRVWIDMTASAHVLVFRPLIRILRGRGDVVVDQPRDRLRAEEALAAERVGAERVPRERLELAA